MFSYKKIKWGDIYMGFFEIVSDVFSSLKDKAEKKKSEVQKKMRREVKNFSDRKLKKAYKNVENNFKKEILREEMEKRGIL